MLATPALVAGLFVGCGNDSDETQTSSTTTMATTTTASTPSISSNQVGVDSGEGDQIRLIVYWNTDPDEAIAAVEDLGGSIVEKADQLGYLVVDFPAGDDEPTAALIEAFEERGLEAKQDIVSSDPTS